MSNKAANRFRFDAVRMTGLKYHFNNTVNLVFIYHFIQKLKAIVIRRHNGTADAEVAVGNGPVNIIRIFFDFPFNSLGSRTVFIGYDNTAVISIASITFSVAPPIGQPVMRIRGFLSNLFPAAYSASILSVRAFSSSAKLDRSNLKVLP